MTGGFLSLDGVPQSTSFILQEAEWFCGDAWQWSVGDGDLVTHRAFVS